MTSETGNDEIPGEPNEPAQSQPGPEPRKKQKNSVRLSYLLMLASCLIGIPYLIGFWVVTSRSRKSDALGKAEADIMTWHTSLTRYKTTMGAYPSALKELVHRPAGTQGEWRPFIKESALIDPWGEPYQYRHPGLKNPGSYDLFSKGPDKTAGTPDDMKNWQDGDPTSRAKSSVSALETSIIRYKISMNKLPAALEDLVRRPEGAQHPWRQLIWESVLFDPWGEPYQYRHPGIKNPDSYDLFSKGPDKTEGTPDDIRGAH